MLMYGYGGMVNAINSNHQIGEEVNMLSQIGFTPYKTTKKSHSDEQNQPEKNRLNGQLRSKL